MSAHPEERFYVRVRGRVQGPYPLSRLRVLRARGQFSRVFEVSADGQTWVSSETLSDFVDPAPTAPDVELDPGPARGQAAAPGFERGSGPADERWDDWEPRRRRKSESHLGTIVLLFMLVIVPAGIVGGIVLLKRLEENRAAAPVEEPVVEEDDEGLGPATFAYWTKFKDARNGLDWNEGATPHEIATKIRAAADEMSELSTLGVDPEAVGLVIDYAAALNQLAAAIRDANDPDTYVEAFVRGAAGDPFGKAIELKSSTDAAMRQLSEVEQRSIRVRAALTSTYSRQFP